MRSLSNSTLMEFQEVADDIRRQRADLEARLALLATLRAETDKLISESKARIEQSKAVLGAMELLSSSHVTLDHRQRSSGAGG